MKGPISVEKQRPPRGINAVDTTISPHDGGPCVTPQTIPQTVLFPDSLRQAPRRDVRPPAREFRWRRGPAQGGGARVWVGGGFRPLSGGPAGARKDPAHADGVARPADLRHCLRPSRWQRRRPPRRRPHPQAAARAGPGRWRGVGLVSRRSRGSRTALAPPPSMSWRASWRCGSSSGISAGWTGGRGGSRST